MLEKDQKWFFRNCPGTFIPTFFFKTFFTNIFNNILCSSPTQLLQYKHNVYSLNPKFALLIFWIYQNYFVNPLSTLLRKILVNILTSTSTRLTTLLTTFLLLPWKIKVNLKIGHNFPWGPARAKFHSFYIFLIFLIFRPCFNRNSVFA